MLDGLTLKENCNVVKMYIKKILVYFEMHGIKEGMIVTKVETFLQ